MVFGSTDKPSSGSAGATSGVVSVSGPVKANQGDASLTAWPFFTSQTVSSVITGTVSVSGNVGVSGFVTISGAVSGVQSISGTVNVAQTGSPWGVSGTVTALVTGFVSISNTVTVTGFVSVSNSVLVTGTVSVSGNVGVSGFVTISGVASVSGTVSVSGSVGVNQGAASATGWPVYLGGASAASGYSTFQNTALSNTVVNVKASSGNVYGYHFYNPNTTDCYVQMFKVTAASVTLSSTVAQRTLWVPALGGLDSPAAGPLNFASGIAIATTLSKSGSTANSTSILAVVDYY